MTFVNPYDIKRELVNFLRNSNIISTSSRGVTTTSDTYDSTAGQTVFVLTHANLKNVRTVTVNAASKSYGVDYSVNFETYTITLTTPVLIHDAVVVSYDYGTSDKIFPDYPQKSITMNSLPRVGFDILSGDSTLNSLGDVTVTSKIIVSANVYDTDYKSIDDIITALRNALNTNAKLFYTFNFIKPKGLFPIIRSPVGEDKVLQRTADFEILILNEG